VGWARAKHKQEASGRKSDEMRRSSGVRSEDLFESTAKLGIERSGADSVIQSRRKENEIEKKNARRRKEIKSDVRNNKQKK
jgi:hypothetical protein